MRRLHNAAAIGPVFDKYRATTCLTRKEIAAELGMSLRALDGVMCRYRKTQRAAAAEATESSDVFEFIQSGLNRAAALAPPLPTAEELAAWHRVGCPLGGRLTAHPERAA